jgi:hypothetical protein
VEMELLPAIPAIQMEITYDALQERIEDAAVQVTNLEEAITELQPYVHVFADPSSVKPREIGGLMDTMRALIDEQAALDQCNEAQVILARMFNGSRTSRVSLENVVRWAVAAQPIGKLLSAILAADDTAHARSRISEVLEAERSTQEILEGYRPGPKLTSSIFRRAATPGAKVLKNWIAPRTTPRAFLVMLCSRLCWRRSALKGYFRWLRKGSKAAAAVIH